MSNAMDRKLLDKCVMFCDCGTTPSIRKERTVSGLSRLSLFTKWRHLMIGRVREENRIVCTHFAVYANVAPAAQNQAMNALIILYRKVLKQTLVGEIHAMMISIFRSWVQTKHNRKLSKQKGFSDIR